jgi:hypothetical protein
MTREDSTSPGAPALRGPVTPQDVLNWGRAAGWDNSTLVKIDVRNVANFCNRTWREQQWKKIVAHKVDEVQRKTKRARNLASGLSSVCRAMVADVATWRASEQDTAGLSELRAFVTKFADAWDTVEWVFAPTRPAGAQSVAWASFVAKLETHLSESLDLPRMAVTPDSPAGSFLASAIEAVFGEDVTPEAVAKHFARRRARHRGDRTQP